LCQIIIERISAVLVCVFTVVGTPSLDFNELTKPRSDHTLTNISAAGHGSGGMVWSSRYKASIDNDSTYISPRSMSVDIVSSPKISVTADIYTCISLEALDPTRILQYLRQLASCPGSLREKFLDST